MRKTCQFTLFKEHTDAMDELLECYPWEWEKEEFGEYAIRYTISYRNYKDVIKAATYAEQAKHMPTKEQIVNDLVALEEARMQFAGILMDHYLQSKTDWEHFGDMEAYKNMKSLGRQLKEYAIEANDL